MHNSYVYYVMNNGVFHAQPAFVDLDEAPHLKDNPEYRNNCEKINAMRIDEIKMKKDLFYFIDDDGDVCSTNRKDIYEKWNDWITERIFMIKSWSMKNKRNLKKKKQRTE